MIRITVFGLIKNADKPKKAKLRRKMQMEIIDHFLMLFLSASKVSTE